jgi:glyoxylase-like metal-dependent hydrolase (beta-lactamase superfamily II)
MMHNPFLEDLADLGYPVDSIDTVMCTHLHVDHVGWNTRLDDGKWVPTFPKARYLFARKEWEHWTTDGVSQITPDDAIGDSVRPILEAGLADLVEVDHRVSDEVWFEPTPGHSPAHVSVHIASRGDEAIITGDMIHHPLQLSEPDLITHFCFDRAQARTTRRAFLEKYQDRPVLVLGTHFHAPTAGYVVHDGNAWRLKY